MESKTPNFDAKMKTILDKTLPGVRTCHESGESFVVRPEDLEFYKTMMVPAPTLSPWIRQRRRYAHVVPGGEYLFKRKSSLSGKEVITNIDPGCPVKVYANDEWWSDQWDATAYGVDYDPAQSFFEQFYDLSQRVPRPAKVSGTNNENSDWGVAGSNLKNCYMYYGGNYSENTIYTFGAKHCRDIVDCCSTYHCELSYDLFECNRCYGSLHLESCDDCLNCFLGFDLKNCESCFGCVNLRHKKYCFFNEQLTKDGYEDRMRQIELSSRKTVKEWSQKFDKFCHEKAFRQNLRLKNVENSTGDDLTNCQNCFLCFSSFDSQNLAYAFYSSGLRNCQDVDATVDAEYSIEAVLRGGYNVKYCSDLIYNSSNIEYCELVYSLENCFGCVGLKNKNFHILNKLYGEEEYWKLVDKIKCDMLERGEYGKSFPIKHSIYPYNLTAGVYLYPLDNKTIEQLGARIYQPEPVSPSQGINAGNLPDNIKDVSADIVGKPLICAETGQLFSIIKQELEFYQKMNIPVPTLHPMKRRLGQYAKFRAPRLVKNSCGQCGKEIFIRGISSVESQRIKNVCEDCYLKIVGYDVQNT